MENSSIHVMYCCQIPFLTQESRIDTEFSHLVNLNSYTGTVEHLIYQRFLRPLLINPKKGCYVRKTKLLQESKDFGRNWETCKIFWEARSNEVKMPGILRIFSGISPKNLGQYVTFSGGFLFTHSTAQTQFVRAVTPYNDISILSMQNPSKTPLSKFKKHVYGYWVLIARERKRKCNCCKLTCSTAADGSAYFCVPDGPIKL